MADLEFDTKWSLFFHEKNSSKAYLENIVKLIDIITIRDFWGTINNIPMPKDLFSNYGVKKTLRIDKTNYCPNGYSFFKNGEFPSWENTREGSEVCLKTSSIENINYIFNELLLECVSSLDPVFDTLIGIRVIDASYNKVNNYKLEMWFNNICDVKNVKNYLTTKLNIKDFHILYREHLYMKEN